MKLLALLFLYLTTTTMTLFNFKTTSDISNWKVVNDGVMGGLSLSSFTLNEKGKAVFQGHVTTQNNGGFASVRTRTQPIPTKDKTHLKLTIKGDGNRYQLRIRANQNDYQAYITYFETTGAWETIEIPLHKMYPTFRGRTLPMNNFDADSFSEIGFLIGNKQEQDFQLEIDTIELK